MSISFKSSVLKTNWLVLHIRDMWVLDFHMRSFHIGAYRKRHQVKMNTVFLQIPFKPASKRSLLVATCAANNTFLTLELYHEILATLIILCYRERERAVTLKAKG